VSRGVQTAETEIGDTDFRVIVQGILDALDVAVVMYAPDNRPLFHNRKVGELLALAGYDPETGWSKHVYGTDHHTPVKAGKDVVRETLVGDGRGIVYWVGDPEGEQRGVISEAHHISRPDGSDLGSVVLVYDVTDLATLAESREEFAATLSHELRTPVTSALGYLDLIAESGRLEGSDLHEAFRVAHSRVMQIARLVTSLASPRLQRSALNLEPIDVGAAVDQSIDGMRAAAQSAGQSLTIDLPDRQVHGHIDSARLIQAVDNLLSNAVKYTPSGGTITVSLHEEDGTAVISCADTGPGIDAGDCERVFERFFRARRARQSGVPGVGLGLTIVKTIVDEHQGEVTVESTPGVGSCFTMRIPLHPAGAPLSRVHDDL
jgi:signal transduction histidine kinase